MFAFAPHRFAARDGIELECWHEGVGGTPLLLVHGWPETRRIWARTIAPLAAAGFEVVVPDLRGFGGSDLAPDGRYDLAAHARDLVGLMAGLGHATFSACGSDLAGPILIDLGLRFAGTLDAQVLFNCPLPVVPDTVRLPARARQAADYFVRQGCHADELAAELDTPERRRRYIASFYTSRFWGTPGGFDAAAVDWMTEPWADAERFRASLVNYEVAKGVVHWTEEPRFFEPVEVPTLVLHGPDDHVIPEDFCDRARTVFTRLVGPFVVPGSGHFMQWEQPEILVGALTAFLRGGLQAVPTIRADVPE